MSLNKCKLLILVYNPKHKKAQSKIEMGTKHEKNREEEEEEWGEVRMKN